MVEVDVDGERRLILADDLDDLVQSTTTTAIRLLPGFDQYVLGPGTDEIHIIPAARRAAVSKQSGWIAPTVISRGVVTGTWELVDDEVRIAWYTEAAKPRPALLEDAVARYSAIADRAFRPVVGFV